MRRIIPLLLQKVYDEAEHSELITCQTNDYCMMCNR
jgi:hypothetical protein